MIRAKNYKTVTKFVKVMLRIPWPLFFPGHGVELYSLFRMGHYRFFMVLQKTTKAWFSQKYG